VGKRITPLPSLPQILDKTPVRVKVEDNAVQERFILTVKTVPLRGQPFFDIDMLEGIHGDLTGRSQGIGIGPAGYPRAIFYIGLKADGSAVGLIIVNHKQKIAIRIILDNFPAPAVGNVKKTVPHRKSSLAYPPIPFKAEEGNLILHRADVKRKEIFTLYGIVIRRGAGGAEADKQTG
jgi:hypothetical protein